MKLRFDGTGVARCIKHALASEKHGTVYGQESAGPSLWLVHDQGVYLMSNGKPGDRVDQEDAKFFVVYAEGCNPNTDEDWWETAREAVGGDDFAEPIALEGFAKSLATVLGRGCRDLVINLTEDSYAIETVRSRKGAPSAEPTGEPSSR